VTALECDLEGVLTDERDILDAELVGREARHAGKTSGRAGLAPAFGARARPTQALARVSAAVAAFPDDLHDLAVAVDVDRKRKRIWVFQLPI
jgi:hypothetical protein